MGRKRAYFHFDGKLAIGLKVLFYSCFNIIFFGQLALIMTSDDNMLGITKMFDAFTKSDKSAQSIS